MNNSSWNFLFLQLFDLKKEWNKIPGEENPTLVVNQKQKKTWKHKNNIQLQEKNKTSDPNNFSTDPQYANASRTCLSIYVYFKLYYASKNIDSKINS